MDAKTTRRNRILLFLGIVGPGIIAASAGNDSGGISTYSVAGSSYGYTMLWMMLAMTPSFMIVQEMAGRMGAVTGKGFSALIREKFGLRPTFLAMMLLFASNLATTVAEFAGIAAALQLFGVSLYLSVPVAAVIVWLLIVRGSYRDVEKVLLALSAVFVAYIIAAFMSQPEWGDVAKAFVTPRIVPTPAFIALAIGLTGTTIAPWMQFLLQSQVVEKGTTIKEWGLAKWDAMIGAASANVIACFIIITTGTVLYPRHITIDSAKEAALALAPVAGQYAQVLFAIGLLSASVLAAAVLPLTAAFAICEAFGFEAGVDRSWNEAPIFNGLYTVVIFGAAAVVLIPNVSLIAVMLVSQVVNGIMLPFLLIFMMLIINDRRVMGSHTNGTAFNVVAWSTIVVVISLTAALLLMTATGFGT